MCAATGLPPGGLQVWLSNWGVFGNRGSGAAPLAVKRFSQALSRPFAYNYLIGSLDNTPSRPLMNAIASTIAGHYDILYNYNVNDITALDSDDVCETIFHELCHAAHYNKVGEDCYAQFVGSLTAEIGNTLGNANLSPYGGGDNPNHSPIIALGEGWACHMGRVPAGQTPLRPTPAAAAPPASPTTSCR